MRKLFRKSFEGILLGALIISAGCSKSAPVAVEALVENQQIGFDVDDTLLFSTPAFMEGFNSEARPFSPEFWEVVNVSDRGRSIVKKKAAMILEEYRESGDDIYIITARQPNGGEVLKEYLNEEFSVPEENIYFAPDGKADLLSELGVDIYYGDSDSDITAAYEAGAIAYRIERSTASSYSEKYNPGSYGETVIENSEW